MGRSRANTPLCYEGQLEIDVQEAHKLDLSDDALLELAKAVHAFSREDQYCQVIFFARSRSSNQILTIGLRWSE